jgi:hypothetical protein
VTQARWFSLDDAIILYTNYNLNRSSSFSLLARDKFRQQSGFERERAYSHVLAPEVLLSCRQSSFQETV